MAQLARARVQPAQAPLAAAPLGLPGGAAAGAAAGAARAALRVCAAAETPQSAAVPLRVCARDTLPMPKTPQRLAQPSCPPYLPWDKGQSRMYAALPKPVQTCWASI